MRHNSLAAIHKFKKADSFTPGVAIFDSKYEDFEKLADDFILKSKESDEQEVLGNFFEIWRKEAKNYLSDHNEVKNGIENGMIKTGVMDKLAWYCPATFNDSQVYGIYFDCQKIVAHAKFLADINPSSPSFTWQEFLPLFLYTIFCHEVAHGWVEDVCYLIDLKVPALQKPEDRQSYKDSARRGYIPREEAFCETVAYWMLNAKVEELQTTRPRDKEKFAAMREIILWHMTQLPAGYCDLDQTIGACPDNLGGLVDRFVDLLKEVYKHCEFSSREAVLIFLYFKFNGYVIEENNNKSSIFTILESLHLAKSLKYLCQKANHPDF